MPGEETNHFSELVSSGRQRRHASYFSTSGDRTFEELVVQDAASYQDLLDRFAKDETVAAIRRGLADAGLGRLTPLAEPAGRLHLKHVLSGTHLR